MNKSSEELHEAEVHFHLSYILPGQLANENKYTYRVILDDESKNNFPLMALQLMRLKQHGEDLFLYGCQNHEENRPLLYKASVIPHRLDGLKSYDACTMRWGMLRNPNRVQVIPPRYIASVTLTPVTTKVAPINIWPTYEAINGMHSRTKEEKKEIVLRNRKCVLEIGDGEVPRQYKGGYTT